MPEHILTPDEKAALRRDIATPIIAADLREARGQAEAGTLPDDRLKTLIDWLGSYHWSRLGDPVKLRPEEHRESRAIVALAVHRQHSGRFVTGGVAWVSTDGRDLKAGLPT